MRGRTDFARAGEVDFVRAGEVARAKWHITQLVLSYWLGFSDYSFNVLGLRLAAWQTVQLVLGYGLGFKVLWF